MEISQGHILEVTADDFKGIKRVLVECECCGNKKMQDVEQIVKKGSFIEIRYPTAWHYRTESNEYYFTKEQDVIDKCKMYGIIDEEVRWKNKTNLKEILKNKLYKAI